MLADSALCYQYMCMYLLLPNGCFIAYQIQIACLFVFEKIVIADSACNSYINICKEVQHICGQLRFR